MKKIYFINPSYGFDIYYSLYPDDFDVSAATRINIGYNDSYEMRSQYLGKPYFSDNVEDIREILQKRKKVIMAEKYGEMLKIM